MGVREELPLPAVCRELGRSWSQVWRLVLRGTLDGRQVNGRWLIRRKSVERLKRVARIAGSRSAA